MSELRIINGRIIRPGFFRGVDPATLEYFQKLAGEQNSQNDGLRNDAECVFCPIDELPTFLNYIPGSNLAEVNATPPYEHFGGHKVEAHSMVIPGNHIDSLHKLSPEQMRYALEFARRKQVAAVEMGQRGVWYTRVPDNLSKSVGHLHSHLLTLGGSPLKRFQYGIKTGATDLEYGPEESITDEQILAFFGGQSTVESQGAYTWQSVGSYFEMSSEVPAPDAMEHFDAHRVVGQFVIRIVDQERPFIRLPHKAIEEYYEYINVLNESLASQGDGQRTFVQDFSPHPLAKPGFSSHILALDYSPVGSISMENGKQTVEFINPTDEQVAAINRSREKNT